MLQGLSSRSTSAARLGRLLAAAIQAQKGNYDAALAGAEPLLLDDALQDSTERLVLGDRFARTAFHYLRGQWYTHVGQPAQAEKSWLWYENSDFEGWPATEAQAAEIDWAFGTVGRLRRAEAELASGERQRACAHLKRIIELWSAPDATTAPAANRARQLAAQCPR